ncbi:chalcone isomerase family protein [Thalassotalea sp. G2M2-11]|uniref:chalcone isomerase family protein n=1 Tax=Thalassotalea sp. G2M2-11 TaxID=2787627 RepID=UPI0019D29FF6|nr:chalcone isomerase family protein [Thalassotalea sp. G2M2-11]
MLLNSKLIFGLVAVVIVCSFSAVAKPQLLPPSTLDIAKYTVIGQARFSVLFWDIYDSRLLSSTGDYDTCENQDLVFEIQYLKDIKAGELLTRTVEQWQHLSINQARYQAYLPKLAKLWPDIQQGDRLALLVSENASVFYFNNDYLGHIQGRDFGQLFLAIWLSPKSSQPELRQQLLGK